jgi:hypothetical protein
MEIEARERIPGNSAPSYLLTMVMSSCAISSVSIATSLPSAFKSVEVILADPARFSLAHGGKDRHPYPHPHGREVGYKFRVSPSARIDRLKGIAGAHRATGADGGA